MKTQDVKEVAEILDLFKLANMAKQIKCAMCSKSKPMAGRGVCTSCAVKLDREQDKWFRFIYE